MTATEALERRIDELCRENEKLRQYNNTLRNQIDTAKHNSVRNTREYARLCHVNDKLRELVRDMCKAFIHGPCYRWCEHMPEPCNGDKCQYVRRMRELGVDA